MKDAAILSDHDIGIIAIFKIEQVLYEAKTRICLCEFGQNGLLRMLLAQLCKIWQYAITLMGRLDLMYGLTAFYKLVKGTCLFRKYFVGDNIILPQKSIHVFDHLHGNYLVC